MFLFLVTIAVWDKVFGAQINCVTHDTLVSGDSGCVDGNDDGDDDDGDGDGDGDYDDYVGKQS